MTGREWSRHVRLFGLGSVEDSGGKTVDSAVLRVETRPGPTPARRVVTLRTGDGFAYRFQRYGPDEPLTFWNRESPDGDVSLKASNLPEHVEAVVAAVNDGRVSPDPVELRQVLDEVGERPLSDGDENDASAARESEKWSARTATDGGAAAGEGKSAYASEWPTADSVERVGGRVEDATEGEEQ